jgi:hypothetical protein
LKFTKLKNIIENELFDANNIICFCYDDKCKCEDGFKNIFRYYWYHIYKAHFVDVDNCKTLQKFNSHELGSNDYDLCTIYSKINRKEYIYAINSFKNNKAFSLA